MATPDDIAETWLSLTNEQRSELLALRRQQQLDDEQDAPALPPGGSKT